MSIPVTNYAIDAVARSASQNMFAQSKADNLETTVVCAGVTISVTDSSATPIPASVFANGSGLYHLWCNGPGNYDLCSTGNIVITPAGTVASAAGFFSQSIQSVAAGGAVTQASLTNSGTGPVITQNSGATQSYSCQAIKIGN